MEIINYNTLNAFTFSDSMDYTLILSNIQNYTVMAELVEEFRQLTGYYTDFITKDLDEGLEYNIEDFCKYVKNKGYIIDIPRSDIDISF